MPRLGNNLCPVRLAGLFERLGISEYLKAFEQQQVDVAALLQLTQQDVACLGQCSGPCGSVRTALTGSDWCAWAVSLDGPRTKLRSWIETSLSNHFRLLLSLITNSAQRTSSARL